ncbi:hypothetical protein JCM9140_455 [Halalkalibacter wakoensis JCM 9140]|uniref:YCII-related domain-containing protein n=1 Tax=Halalkalibacter wakoensis JCM 9140 TaxID=1236970 RepID=W4PZJ4_9BACI|nr:YciI family protein [Halalkalibacter wakoensis]GAE24519.1 hypothetical protein JCM9140_455 [Halalkalibacter wakoensis JCM 9140]
MSYFAAILLMKNPELNATYRAEHLAYLEQLEANGNIFAKGPFVDGAGGLVIYKADSFEEAKKLAEADPYVIQGVRTLQLHEWGMVQS